MSTLPAPAVSAASMSAVGVSAYPPASWRARDPEDERIWYEAPGEFLRSDRLSRIVPIRHTGIDAQLNAILRFAIYFATFVSLLRRSASPFLSIVTVVALITFLVHKAEAGEDEVRRERMDALEVERDPVTRRLCTRPTLDNPYMNVLMSDFKRFPERPGACDITRIDVRDRAEDLSAHDLYVDSDDVYGRRANASAFYTNAATTIPNDQDGFARWLYQPPAKTCREGDGEACWAKTYYPY